MAPPACDSAVQAAWSETGLAGRGLANGHHGRYFGGYGPVGNLTDTSALICRFPGEISPKMRK
ncbi:hypothetical protein ACFPES_26265 [Paenibacillus sp. GCM10023248]|uniref:hypothetical protein n=1 Tax=Bacillales TaxID=1385 RepID=UPI002377FCB5|nr:MULTISPECIES: hypothetical protein [Bacillales]MDD9270564.1 hypothetical protein [Paenibacillus sp. MAHUQ-63]MDR6884768.1 hypothetical protein [Bacillus sp. 3255]